MAGRNPDVWGRLPAGRDIPSLSRVHGKRQAGGHPFGRSQAAGEASGAAAGKTGTAAAGAGRFGTAAGGADPETVSGKPGF